MPKFSLRAWLDEGWSWKPRIQYRLVKRLFIHWSANALCTSLARQCGNSEEMSDGYPLGSEKDATEEDSDDSLNAPTLVLGGWEYKEDLDEDGECSAERALAAFIS